MKNVIWKITIYDLMLYIQKVIIRNKFKNININNFKIE